MIVNEKTTVAHWDQRWSSPPRMRLPSALHVATRDRMRLLRGVVVPGMTYLEIGCAPGKLLAWVGKVLKASVSGIDYSPRGIEHSRKLLRALRIEADLRCEDVLTTTFPLGSFDVVHSAGVVEHFHDPLEIVRMHLALLKSGGTAIITIPRLAGIYKRLAAYFTPGLLSMHNLDIMSAPSLRRLAPSELCRTADAFPYGRVSADLIEFRERWPRPVASLVSTFINCVGLVQPFRLPPLCPQFVLRMVKK